MVKIDPNHSIPNITELSKTHSQQKPQKGEFDAIFRQTVDVGEIKSTPSEATAFVSDVPEIRPARFDAQPAAEPSANKIVDQVEELIDTMEAYQQKLADNGATLKDVQPLIEKMVTHNQELTAISGILNEPDDLGEIVNQSLKLSSMEIARYKSGAYNNG